MVYRKVVLTLSGGIDSTALLYLLLSKGHYVQALGIDYGQRHRKELKAAQDICDRLNVSFECADLTTLGKLISGSALTSQEMDVPSGNYHPETMKTTVVPNRNMMMLSVAMAWAINSKCDTVAYAAHAGDHAIYPDCRPEFVSALAKVANLCHFDSIELLTPFLDWTKADIVRLGHRLGVPFNLTWSCYRGENQHCGNCGTCRERADAFTLSGVSDPTYYRSTSCSTPVQHPRLDSRHKGK